jgi:hypothetical protein
MRLKGRAMDFVPQAEGVKPKLCRGALQVSGQESEKEAISIPTPAASA